jgi:hypothetical protein
MKQAIGRLGDPTVGDAVFMRRGLERRPATSKCDFGAFVDTAETATYVAS